MLVFGGNVIPNEPLKENAANDGVGDVRTYMVLCSMNVEDVSEVNSIPVVSEFPEVFLDDICELPPKREVEFIIDLVPGACSKFCQLCRKKWLCSSSFCCHRKGSISRVLDIF